MPTAALKSTNVRQSFLSFQMSVEPERSKIIRETISTE